jgi:DNA-binding NarL/FixJ family response regulator
LIGEAATGREAMKAAVIDKPDVIIMDLAMPDTDGFSATAEISRMAPEGGPRLDDRRPYRSSDHPLRARPHGG